MTMPPPGTIGWMDLTVPDAPLVRDFYQAVAGWSAVPLSMGDYDDFVMLRAGSDEPIAGVCHARGVNADIPPQWLLYIVVADLDVALAEALARGGSVVRAPTPMSAQGRFVVLRDPAGAVVALHQAPAA